jgi:tetratricopeptide (TPR) repeat protein
MKPSRLTVIALMLCLPYFCTYVWAQTDQVDYSKKGSAEILKGNYNTALNYLTMSISRSHQGVDYLKRAFCYANLDRYVEAGRDLDSAFVLGFPRKTMQEALLLRGTTRFHLKKYAEAISDLSQVITIDSSLGEAYYYRAMSHSCLMNLYDAGRDYTKAIELEPNNTDFRFMRGVFFHMMEEDESAVSDFTVYLQAVSDNPYAYYLRGDSYLELHRLDEALRDLDRAIELDPKKADYLAARGKVRFQQRMYGMALKDFRKAIQLKPEMEDELKEMIEKSEQYFK